ncbi:hypothetical protein RSAG8_04849, partial [Rhizoctonia solani AG-8 WAC10335]
MSRSRSKPPLPTERCHLDPQLDAILANAERKKKCDETQPHCLRCTRSGKECEGYAPLESPDGRGIMRRAKVAPGRASVSQLRSSDTLDSPEEKPNPKSPASTNLSGQRDISGPLTLALDQGPSFSQWSGAEKPISRPLPEAIGHPNAVISTSLPAEEKCIGLSTTPFASLNPGVTSGPVLFYPPTSGNYLIDSHYEDVKPFQSLESPSVSRHYQLIGPGLPHGSISEVEEEDDLEGDLKIKQEMCVVPVLDPNTTDNTLPFVLECYARWIKLVVFEPSKAVQDDDLSRKAAVGV